MREENTISGTLLEEACLTLEEFAAACAVRDEWVLRHVEEGLLSCTRTSDEWRFSARELARARQMHRLERDFDADPELAALVADLLDEIAALRARLRRAGLG